MVEIHCALGKPAAAVGTWDRTQSVEEIGVVPPPITTRGGDLQRRFHPSPEPDAVPRARAQPMAIRADHVAFDRFLEELGSTLERGAAGTQGELLLTRVTMVEIHLMSGEKPAAVGARDFA